MGSIRPREAISDLTPLPLSPDPRPCPCRNILCDVMVGGMTWRMYVMAGDGSDSLPRPCVPTGEERGGRRRRAFTGDADYPAQDHEEGAYVVSCRIVSCHVTSCNVIDSFVVFLNFLSRVLAKGKGGTSSVIARFA